MLEYRENIGYDADGKDVGALIEELREARGIDAEAHEIYDAIYDVAMRDIQLRELAITAIMPDLLEMLDDTPKKARLVMLLLADPYASYSDLGERMGYSKQRASIILHELAGRYGWLSRLLALHNENGSGRQE